jgi:hypothetical protein
VPDGFDNTTTSMASSGHFDPLLASFRQLDTFLQELSIGRHTSKDAAFEDWLEYHRRTNEVGIESEHLMQLYSSFLKTKSIANENQEGREAIINAMAIFSRQLSIVQHLRQGTKFWPACFGQIETHSPETFWLPREELVFLSCSDQKIRAMNTNT